MSPTMLPHHTTFFLFTIYTFHHTTLHYTTPQGTCRYMLGTYTIPSSAVPPISPWYSGPPHLGRRMAPLPSRGFSPPLFKPFTNKPLLAFFGPPTIRPSFFWFFWAPTHIGFFGALRTHIGFFGAHLYFFLQGGGGGDDAKTLRAQSHAGLRPQ